AHSRTEYLRKAYAGNGSHERKRRMLEEKQSLGRFHFTASRKKFQKLKETLECTAVVLCNGSVCDEKFIEKIAGALRKRGLHVSFANLTNVHEHASNVRLIARLPFKREAVIMWSEHAHEFDERGNTITPSGGELVSAVTIGINRYAREAGRQRNWRETFSAHQAKIAVLKATRNARQAAKTPAGIARTNKLKTIPVSNTRQLLRR
ncbi:hypothetical protein HY992_04510, partial [Candidatus Micrarchaeota archaeon]|nr:hypothetical protein [Candidatus Micrarchaeota archaeon]